MGSESGSFGDFSWLGFSRSLRGEFAGFGFEAREGCCFGEDFYLGGFE